MPSPVGHAVAGLIVALALERRIPAGKKGAGGAGSTTPATYAPTDLRTRALFLVCMFLAALPDIDYLYPPIHRGPTHSMGATVIVMLAAAGVTWWTTGRIRWPLAIVCGLAHFSHVVMDWLGEDPTATPGVMALWPLSDRLFISGSGLFRSTWRINPLAPANLAHNLRTLAQEMILLGPILFWLLWRRGRTRA